jgi:uncharacterized membrane protein YwaF
MYMYMMFVHKYIPTFKSFKKSFLLLLAIVLFFIVPINLIFDTNFMYLNWPGDTPFSLFESFSYPLYLASCILLSMIGMAIWYSPVALYNYLRRKNEQ